MVLFWKYHSNIICDKVKYKKYNMILKVAACKIQVKAEWLAMINGIDAFSLSKEVFKHHWNKMGE